MKFLTLFVLLAAVLPNHLSAQEPPDSKSSVTLKIRTACAALNRHRTVSISSGEEEEKTPLTLFDDSFSQEVTYKGSIPILVFAPGAEKPFATVSPPASSKDLTLLFVPDTRNPQIPYRVLAMETSGDSFPWGTRRFVNLAPSPVAMRYGTLGKSAQFADSRPKDILITKSEAGSERFAVEFFLQNSDRGWDRFSATRWTADLKKRSLVFFYINPANRRPTYKSIAEYFVDEAAVLAAAAAEAEKEPDKPPVDENPPPPPARNEEL